MLENIKPGWTCLDLGSNVGYFSELLWSIVGEEGQVLAFDANKNLIEHAKVASTLNKSSIKYTHACLSNVNEELTLRTPSHNIGAATVREAYLEPHFNRMGPIKEETVVAVPLKEIYSGPADYIKLDIEGHEEKVLQGFSEQTSLCPLMTLEVTPLCSVPFIEHLLTLYNFYNLNNELLAKDSVMSRVLSWDAGVLAPDLVLRVK
jgi:FkbM family methyltransferase